MHLESPNVLCVHRRLDRRCQALEVSAEGPVTVEGQAQIFHAGSDLDLSPFQPQATARWRRSVIGSAAEPHCLGFLRGHPQSQSLDRSDHAGYRQLRQADGSAPRRAPDQHQRVVGVVRQCRVRRHRRPKYRVVRNVPQQRTQHRTLRDPTVHRPFSHPPATDGVDARTTPRYSGTRWNLRARHILSQGMLLKALTSDTANATQPRRLAPSTRERTRATASAVDRPLRKPNWLSCSPGSLRDKCDSRWAVAILSSSLLASSKRHTGRKAEGKSGERPSFHKTGNSPETGICRTDALISGPRPRRRPSTGGPGLRRDPQLSTLRSSRQPRPILPRWPSISGSKFPRCHVALPPAVEAPTPPRRWTCYLSRSPLPGTGCRQPPPGTEGTCSPLREAPMGGVCSIPSCKGTPRDRSRGWPEARPKLVSSPNSLPRSRPV